MSFKKSKHGFSLIELMVVMLAFSVLILIVGSVLVYTWKGWKNYSEYVALQRDAMLAIRMVEKEIRNSNIDEISGDSAGLYFSNGTTRTNTYVFNSTDIVSSPGVLLSTWENPVIGSNSVQVAFSLKTQSGSFNREYEVTIHPRNKP